MQFFGYSYLNRYQTEADGPMDTTVSAVIDKHDIGFLPVDIRGRPLVNKGKTGTWKATAFILAMETAERMSYIGILVNMVSYLVFSMHLTFPKSSDVVNNLVGTTNLTPLLGAFIADAYLGRYWTLLIFGLIYILGSLLLTLLAFIPTWHPSNVTCTSPILAALGQCQQPSDFQLAVLYLGLYIIALGTGGIIPCVSAFGADQFDEEDPKESVWLPSYFNAYYFFVTVGAILSLTLVVNVSESVAYKWGFLITLLSMILALGIFLAGTPRYRHRLPSARLSPLTRIAQVFVAASRKFRLQSPRDGADLYEVYDKESAIVGSRKLAHTPQYRWLDKAAVQTDEDDMKQRAENPSPWKVCTVTQVEEVKALIRIMPIWCTGIILNMAFIQIINFALQGGSTMNRTVAGAVIPIPTFGIASTLVLAVTLPIYDKLFVPLARKYTGNSRGITLLQRQGIGHVFMVLGLLCAGTVEHKRRATAYNLGMEDNPLSPLPISAFWLVPIFSLTGLGELFATVGQLEFFYEQAPDAMRSLGIAIFSANTGVGAFVGTAVVHIIKAVTEPDWVAININWGHMDYYYFFLAVLTFLNFLVFLWFAHRYKYKVPPKSTRRDVVLMKASGTREKSIAV
ncbi:hypothetical protein R1flu_025152 [Riccia fluitans]|uniref:NPF family transporter n=1 Tax=Riccia fluitans TaxID=41844 RepID=A0ABD1XWX4_9MARC